MKNFIPDVKGELKRAARVALLAAVAMAGNVQTAHAGGGILGFVRGITDVVEKVSDGVSYATDVVEELSGAAYTGERAFRQLNQEYMGLKDNLSGAEYEIGKTGNNAKEVISIGSTLVNATKSKQKTPQNVAPTPAENVPVTRAQDNNDNLTKQERFDAARAGLNAKLKRNNEARKELNGESTTPNNVSVQTPKKQKTNNTTFRVAQMLRNAANQNSQ